MIKANDISFRETTDGVSGHVVIEGTHRIICEGSISRYVSESRPRESRDHIKRNIIRSILNEMYPPRLKQSVNVIIGFAEANSNLHGIQLEELHKAINIIDEELSIE